jgi:NADPH-dependent 2,4-dienoyl-CoA reductase/sulfur reductase-like enzyme
VRTAQALRSVGYDENAVLVGEEDTLPYDKPPLSKGLLTGALTEDDVRLSTDRSAAFAVGLSDRGPHPPHPRRRRVAGL